jgi:site-specific DNA recombinase
VSAEEQINGLSLDMQEEQCRKAALAAGAESVEVFRDEGLSATSLKRPALQALFSRLSEFDTLYVWRMDRLSRRMRDWGNLIFECGEAGVAFVSVTERIDLNSISGRAMAGMLSVFAEFEVESIRARVKAALAHRVEVEGRHHGQPPYGYRLVTPGEPWEAAPEEAEIVAEIHRRYANGASMIGLVRWLNSEGIPTRHGRRWSLPSLRRILGNPAYLGRNVWRGEALPGKHPPLVAAQLMTQVQARLQAADAVPAQSRTTSLAPLLRCGVCGGRIHRVGGYRSRPGPLGRAVLYGCKDRALVPASERRCSSGVPAAKAEEAIWRFLRWYLDGPFQKAYRVVQQRRASARQSTAYRRDEARLAEVERRLKANLRAFQVGAITEDLLTSENRPLLQERGRLRDELAAVEAVPIPDVADLLAPLDLGPLISGLREKPAETQVAFLKRMFQRIEVASGVLVFVTEPDGETFRVTLPPRWEPAKGRGEDKFLLNSHSL